MAKNRFKLKDKVIVVKLDPELAEELYDDIGEDYRRSLFRIGIITYIKTIRGIKDRKRYTIIFKDLDSPLDEWYFYDQQIIPYNKDTNLDTIRLLYEKKV